MSDSEGAGSQGVVKSAERVLWILEYLTACDRPPSFTDIMRRLGIPRSSLFGLLSTLQHYGWIEQDHRTRTYRLGVRTFEAGNAYARDISLLPTALAQMETIRDVMDETIQVSVLEGRFNVYLGKVEGGQRLRLASQVGGRLPAHATALGKIMLAGLSEQALDDLFAGVVLETYTPGTIVSFKQLKRHIEDVRLAGYAEDIEEHTQGVRCVALPIHDHTGATVAAMSVSFPTVRYAPDRGEQARMLLDAASMAVSRALGHRTALDTDERGIYMTAAE